MKVEDRALAFVTRADEAVVDPASSDEVWADSVRSKTEERLLHVFPFALDQAMRKVPGTFGNWSMCDASTVKAVVEHESLKVFWVLTAHPSGWVRAETVSQMSNFDDERVVPHMANRTLDFVPAIRESAEPLLHEVFSKVLDERVGVDGLGLLPTAVHIAIGKLLRPRAALICPELVLLAVDLAETAADDPPGRLRENADVDEALNPYRQLLKSADPGLSRDALERVMAHIVV